MYILYVWWIHVVCHTKAGSLTLESTWKKLKVPNFLLPCTSCGLPYNIYETRSLTIADMKIDGLPPPLMWWISIFLYLGIRGLLFRIIWCLTFWNRRKIKRLTQFPKINSAPPIFRYITVFHHFRLLFWKKNRSIFLRLQKKGIKLFRRAIPLHQDIKKIDIHHIRGGEPVNFHINHFFRDKQ